MSGFISRIKQLLGRDFEAANLNAPYTEQDLATVYKALNELGYRETNEAYTPEEKFNDVLFDFIKEEDGVRKGLVTLHLDQEKKTGVVDDGHIDIVDDEELLGKLGRSTTVKLFAEEYKNIPVQPQPETQQFHKK